MHKDNGSNVFLVPQLQYIPAPTVLMIPPPPNSLPTPNTHATLSHSQLKYSASDAFLVS